MEERSSATAPFITLLVGGFIVGSLLMYLVVFLPRLLALIVSIAVSRSTTALFVAMIMATVLSAIACIGAGAAFGRHVHIRGPFAFGVIAASLTTGLASMFSAGRGANYVSGFGYAICALGFAFGFQRSRKRQGVVASSSSPLVQE